MRRTHTCPKCGSKKLFVIKEVQQPDVRGPLSLISDVFNDGRVYAGPIESWVCPGCGYTELYTHQEGLVALKCMSQDPTSGVQFIDFDAPAGPYR